MLKQDSAKDATQDIFDKILNNTRKPPNRITSIKRQSTEGSTKFYRRFYGTFYDNIVMGSTKFYGTFYEVLRSLTNVRLLSL
jgi:hypothetical protein